VLVRRLLTVLPAVLTLLVGCGGDSGNNGGSATISGKVVDNWGLPLANRTVFIGSASTTTDASGAFTLTGIATPYDLVVQAPAPDKFASVFVGLTRTDPHVPDLSVNNPAPLTATIQGAITGGAAFPTPPDTETLVTLGAATQTVGGVVVTSTPYSFDVGWASPATITGVVHGLQLTRDANGTVTGYVAHGVKTGVSVSNNATVTGADLALTAPQTDTISVTATLPAGHEIYQRNVILGFDDGTFIPVSADGLDGGTLQVPVPSNIGSNALVQILSVSADGSMESDAQLKGITPGTSGATVSVPAPARLTSPVENATGVGAGTELVWTPVSSAIHVIYLAGAANDPVYGIVSGGSSTHIPDLSGQMLGLPSGHSFDVVMLAFGSFASLDAFAATGTLPAEGSDFQTVSFSGFTTR
jgi:hypothetical protein